MSITVLMRYFAIVREQIGKDGETFELEETATVSELLAHLTARYPVLAPLVGRLRVAVNLEFAPPGRVLADRDEVALIPPVAGGEPRAHLTAQPLDPLEVMARVRADHHGALVSFVGTVRNTNEGQQVCYLEYEAYSEMAEAKMEEIAAEIDERWPECEVQAAHRLGRLGVGETVVVIAVGAPHRQEAFEACQYFIDRIKEVVPIWKREVGPDGEWWV